MDAKLSPNSHHRVKFQAIIWQLKALKICLISYLDQFLTGCSNVGVLLPVVELSHDRINVLVFERQPAGFGGCQLHRTQMVKTSTWKRELACVRLLCRTSKSVSSSIFLMSGSSSLLLSSGRYCRSTGRPEHHINFCQNQQPNNLRCVFVIKQWS